MKRSKGFTLVELLVVVGIIALLVTILMPTLGRAMELARRSICGANLNGIGKGIIIYRTELDAFPLLYGHGDAGVAFNETTDDLWTNPDTTLGTNVMQNAWVLISQGTAERMFACPSDMDYKERSKSVNDSTDLKSYGWVTKNNFSYGMHKPYDDDEDGTNNKASLLSGEPQSAFIIYADKNDGSKGPGMIHWESNDNCNKNSNHREDGFNCLAYSNSVKWHKAKMGDSDADSEAGIDNDDIYTTQDKADSTDMEPSDNPQNDEDTFIVPWEGADGTGAI